MCFGSLLKRIKSKNTEDFEDDVFVMELKDTKDSRPANLNASQSADQLLSEVGLFSWVFFVIIGLIMLQTHTLRVRTGL